MQPHRDPGLRQGCDVAAEPPGSLEVERQFLWAPVRRSRPVARRRWDGGWDGADASRSLSREGCPPPSSGLRATGRSVLTSAAYPQRSGAIDGNAPLEPREVDLQRQLGDGVRDCAAGMVVDPQHQNPRVAAGRTATDVAESPIQRQDQPPCLRRSATEILMRTVSTSWPAGGGRASCHSELRHDRASAAPSVGRSHNRVEPSISVNRNVTVPDGRSPAMVRTPFDRSDLRLAPSDASSEETVTGSSMPAIVRGARTHRRFSRAITGVPSSGPVFVLGCPAPSCRLRQERGDLPPPHAAVSSALLSSGPRRQRPAGVVAATPWCRCGAHLEP